MRLNKARNDDLAIVFNWDSSACTRTVCMSIIQQPFKNAALFLRIKGTDGTGCHGDSLQLKFPKVEKKCQRFELPDRQIQLTVASK